MAGRPRKYRTAAAFARAVDRYFRSISRTEPLTRAVEVGKTAKGKPIYENQAVKNDLGEPVMLQNYLEPPTMSGLCLYLGLSRDAFSEYARRPEFADTAAHARARVEAYLEAQLYRTKQVQGIMFNLQNNFGWRERADFGMRGGELPGGPTAVNIHVVDDAPSDAEKPPGNEGGVPDEGGGDGGH